MVKIQFVHLSKKSFWTWFTHQNTIIIFYAERFSIFIIFCLYRIGICPECPLKQAKTDKVEKYQFGCTKKTNGITSALRCIIWCVWQQTTRYRLGNTASLVRALELMVTNGRMPVILVYWMAYDTYRSTNSNKQEVVQNLVTRSVRRAQQPALTGYRKHLRKWVRT